MRNHNSNLSSPEEGKQISLSMAAKGGLWNKGCAGLQYVSFQCLEVVSILSWSIFSSVVTVSMPQYTFPRTFSPDIADTFSLLFHSLCLLFPSSLPFCFSPFVFFSSMPVLPTYSNFNANMYLVHILSTYNLPIPLQCVVT